MYRCCKLVLLLCSGHKLARAVVLCLTFITLLCMFVAVPMVFIAQARHDIWKDSGLENAAFFTVDFHFGWRGFETLPPAYKKLKDKLNGIDSCTAVSVDYGEIYLSDTDIQAVLCIYPEALRRRIQTPLSEGSFEAAEEDGVLPVVLDSRLKSRYAIGDKISVQCSWNIAGYLTKVEKVATITGFLTSDNDHISTLGGSTAQMLQYYASKAIGNDSYVVLVSDTAFPSKPYTGDCTSMLLFPPAGESVEPYLDHWRQEIAGLGLGQIDSYTDIRTSDLWTMSVLANVDFYLLTAWLMVLTTASLIGFSLMQTEVLRQRMSMFGLMGMSKGRMLAYIAAGCYAPFWIASALGLIAGNTMAMYMYMDYSAAMGRTTLAGLAVTMLPHTLALCIDCTRVVRMDFLKQWNAGRS